MLGDVRAGGGASYGYAGQAEVNPCFYIIPVRGAPARKAAAAAKRDGRLLSLTGASLFVRHEDHQHLVFVRDVEFVADDIRQADVSYADIVQLAGAADADTTL